jgi:hypothetical protein
VDEDLDFTWRRPGGGKDRFSFTASFHPFEVTSPLLKGLNQDQARVRESLVQLGRPRTYSNIEYNIGYESELAVVGEDSGKSTSHAARPVYLNSVGCERSYRTCP